MSTPDLFTHIYETKGWGNHESVSGPGSTLEQTREIRARIPDILNRLGIKSLLDLPCGDFHWMSKVEFNGVHYYGADIVPAMIQCNIGKYGSDDRTFYVIDLLKDPLPKVDLILCRDCLIHFSNAEILQALSNIRTSGCKWLLTTSFVTRMENKDIITGDSRPLNLAKPPFNLQPIEIINEGCTESNLQYTDKSLVLIACNSL